MTRLTGIAAVAASVFFAAPAMAHDPGRGPWDPDHARYHDELEHRGFHRYLEHREAHRHPMTWWEHERLHDELDHEAFHDLLEHREYHRQLYYNPYYDCPPYYFPGYISSPYYSYPSGFSMYFSR